MMKKILIGCEFSGRVREAFRAKGHSAWSCDIGPTDIDSPYHLQTDIRNVLDWGWDMLIAFPPCTYICNTGNRWWSKTPMREEALQFVCDLMNAPIEQIAIENPVGAISSRIMPATQVVEPYFFGDPYWKATCLWLFGLPNLVADNWVEPTDNRRIWAAGNSPERAKFRSITPTGMARAMAEQWG